MNDGDYCTGPQHIRGVIIVHVQPEIGECAPFASTDSVPCGIGCFNNSTIVDSECVFTGSRLLSSLDTIVHCHFKGNFDQGPIICG